MRIAPSIVQPPQVGNMLAFAHLINNRSRFDRFLAGLTHSAKIPTTSASAATRQAEVAISVDQHAIKTTTMSAARNRDPDCYVYALGFAAGTSRADVATACEGGALQYLSSMQMLASLVTQMLDAGYHRCSSELRSVLRAIEADGKVVNRMVAQGRRQREAS